eukprot:Rhum_TRINITY_DN14395_c2_g1::Rhum_TRINITY_DN14395_c2_g1_i1::g.86538::m.86538
MSVCVWRLGLWCVRVCFVCACVFTPSFLLGLLPAQAEHVLPVCVRLLCLVVRPCGQRLPVRDDAVLEAHAFARNAALRRLHGNLADAAGQPRDDHLEALDVLLEARQVAVQRTQVRPVRHRLHEADVAERLEAVLLHDQLRDVPQRVVRRLLPEDGRRHLRGHGLRVRRSRGIKVRDLSLVVGARDVHERRRKLVPRAEHDVHFVGVLQRRQHRREVVVERRQLAWPQGTQVRGAACGGLADELHDARLTVRGGALAERDVRQVAFGLLPQRLHHLRLFLDVRGRRDGRCGVARHRRRDQRLQVVEVDGAAVGDADRGAAAAAGRQRGLGRRRHALRRRRKRHGRRRLREPLLLAEGLLLLLRLLLRRRRGLLQAAVRGRRLPQALVLQGKVLKLLLLLLGERALLLRRRGLLVVVGEHAWAATVAAAAGGAGHHVGAGACLLRRASAELLLLLRKLLQGHLLPLHRDVLLQEDGVRSAGLVRARHGRNDRGRRGVHRVRQVRRLRRARRGGRRRARRRRGSSGRRALRCLQGVLPRLRAAAAALRTLAALREAGREGGGVGVEGELRGVVILAFGRGRSRRGLLPVCLCLLLLLFLLLLLLVFLLLLLLLLRHARGFRRSIVALGGALGSGRGGCRRGCSGSVGGSGRGCRLLGGRGGLLGGGCGRGHRVLLLFFGHAQQGQQR